MGEEDVDERGGGAFVTRLRHQHRLTRHGRDGAGTDVETGERLGGVKQNGGVRGHR
jgi:hypothetical protein